MQSVLVVGSLNTDLVLRTERMPMLGETLFVRDLMTVPGGKGMNQAVAIARLGGRPILAGCLGNDENGEFLLKQLSRESIETRWIKRTGEVATGMAVITVTQKGENSILVYPGSNHALDARWALSAVRENPKVSAIVLQMEIPADVVFRIIKEGADQGIPIVLNPSPFRRIPPELLPKIDVLAINEVEARQLLGKETPPGEAIKAIRGMGVRQTILTRGDKGVHFNDGGEVCHLPSKKVKVVDPTAAGDTFLGAYVAARARGDRLRDAVAYAVEASALAVTKVGAQPSIPYEAQLATKPR